MLRSNPNIEGISINGTKVLLSQFADDMDLFIKFKQECWSATIGTLTDFEEISGLKVNYDKTSVYRLGSIRDTNAKFFSARKIHWNSGPVNILGVTVSYDRQEMWECNIDPLIQKARQRLLPWHIRNLSLRGKIEILNSLVSSLFNYRLAVLPPLPESYVKAIHGMFENFLWEGKKAKIPLEVLQGNKEDGGQALINIRRKDSALKLNWVFQIEKNKILKDLAYAMLENPWGDYIWEIQLSPKDSYTNLEIKHSDFWYGVFLLRRSLDHGKVTTYRVSRNIRSTFVVALGY